MGAWLPLREDGDAGANTGALDFADREVAWGNGWTLNQDALYAARSLALVLVVLGYRRVARRSSASRVCSAPGAR